MTVYITAADLDQQEVQKWIDLALSLNACDPATTYFEYCRDQGMTIRQTVYGAIPADPLNYQAWALWGREQFPSYVDPEVLIMLSDVATWTDFRLAVDLDVYPRAGATIPEHRMLREKWYSLCNGGTVHFPIIEMEVATNVVTLVPIDGE